ncbi:MAG: GNAT family N-acetyltransferase [gamma proteobacterium symbiont of Ctena orbiculata]|nr:MAG: GNAT family N-acetyltransferase [gamma proteobacterium symbiont of Ctena orbiculata]PVV13197.1 MAG: GNAT family N-acetyltransferase [gamma proteobacterium symbiont of Ctena orbiculata]PVV21814.1 MAG: GNAT family N-acetyltransferase [gamma proteobacterium symbiont of Ctena orbiculata]
MPTSVLETERLLLRQWRDDDYEVFAEINADPRVMAFYPNILSPAESDELADRCRDLIAARGWGFWALELKRSGDLIGLIGLNQPQHRLPCSPCTEIGWRLCFEHWGKGYATEAGMRALQFAFEMLLLDQVVAFTTVTNRRSIAVMQRLGMTDSNRNFKHPALESSHALSEHVLYSITRSDWKLKHPLNHEGATQQR